MTPGLYQSRIQALADKMLVSPPAEDVGEEGAILTTDRSDGQQGNDSLWVSGIVQLAARLNAPELKDAGALGTISPLDIEMLNSIGTPISLENLAIQLEYVVSIKDPLVYAGTAAQLETLLDSLPNDSASEEDRIVRQRLAGLQDRLKSLENPDVIFDDVPPGFLNQ